jgi:hypothetical protein
VGNLEGCIVGRGLGLSDGLEVIKSISFGSEQQYQQMLGINSPYIS